MPESGVPKLESSTRREAAIVTLRRAILNGTLSPGERLGEIQLAKDLGINRSTLREAVRTLAHEGLLEQPPYKGLRVATLDAEAIDDLKAVRAELETVAALAIASDATGGRKELLESAWAEYQRFGATDDPIVEQETHLALHRAIWEASGNRFIQRIWSSLESIVNLATANDLATHSGDIQRSKKLHRTLVDTILTGSEEEISREVRRHIYGANAA